VSVISSTWEAEIGRILVLGHPRQKSLQDPIPMEKSWVWWYISVISAMMESIQKEDYGPGLPRQESETLSPK
jgi:hypothetical protein